MRILKHIFLALVFITTTTAYSQQGLSINNFLFSYPADSVVNGSSFSYSSVVYNYSSTAYNGNIVVYSAIDSLGTGGAPANLHLLDSAIVPVSNFQQYDSTSVLDTLPMLIGQTCRGGINTVVIWPVASNFSIPVATQDSIRHDVYVYFPTGIRSVAEQQPIVLGPNPFSEKISVYAGKNTLEQVRIWDARGIVVYENRSTGQSYIETSALAQGVYFVELTFSDGKKTIIKTIKQ